MSANMDALVASLPSAVNSCVERSTFSVILLYLAMSAPLDCRAHEHGDGLDLVRADRAQGHADHLPGQPQGGLAFGRGSGLQLAHLREVAAAVGLQERASNYRRGQ